MAPALLQDIVVLVTIGVAVVLLFHRFRLPPLIGFLATGALVGPHGLGWIGNVQDVERIADIGVVLLLFTIGIEFSLEELSRIGPRGFAAGGLQVASTIGLTFLLAVLFDVPPSAAIFLGMIVALSSTAIVLKVLSDHGEVDTPHGRTSLGILIFQDLAIVPMILLAPFLAGRGGNLFDLAWGTLKSLLLVGAVVVAARRVVPWFLHQVVRTRSREVFLLTIILLCMGTAWITSRAGLSLALGAFIAGLIISESEYSHQALGEILPFRDTFSSLFFVSIGMLFNIRMVLDAPAEVFVGVVALILLKALAAGGVTLLVGYPYRIAVITGISLAQVGEFSFVLSRAGLGTGLLSGVLYQLFLVASVVTMIATPFLMTGAPWLAERSARLLPRRLQRRWREWDPLSRRREASALRDHVIIAGFGMNGQNLARVLKHVEVPYIVVEINPDRFRTERKLGEPIHFGDIGRAEILRRAGIARARMIVIAISDAATTRRGTDLARRLNPGIHIIVRTRYVQEMASLAAIGANEVIPEEFETSIEIFSRVLRAYMVPRDVVERCVGEVRKDGYEMFRSLAGPGPPAEKIRSYLAGVELEIFRIEPGSLLDGKTLAESSLRSALGVSALAVQGTSGMQANPEPATRLEADNAILLMGTPENLAEAAKWFKGPNPDRATDRSEAK